MVIPIHKLVKVFSNLTDKGYCEEDVLDAFIAHLHQLRIVEDDEDQLELIQKRIQSLQRVADEWEGQNNGD